MGVGAAEVEPAPLAARVKHVGHVLAATPGFRRFARPSLRRRGRDELSGQPVTLVEASDAVLGG